MVFRISAFLAVITLYGIQKIKHKKAEDYSSAFLI
jgi:hypothetical protein